MVYHNKVVLVIDAAIDDNDKVAHAFSPFGLRMILIIKEEIHNEVVYFDHAIVDTI